MKACNRYPSYLSIKRGDNDSIFYSITNNIATISTSTKIYENRYYNEYHEGLIELAKGFLTILLNQLVDKTMVAAAKRE